MRTREREQPIPDDRNSDEILVLVADEISRVVPMIESLPKLDRGIILCGIARSAVSLFSETRKLQPDVIVMTEVFQGVDAFSAIHELVEVAPETSLVVVSDEPEVARDRSRALHSDIKEFVLPTVTPEDLASAIRRARARHLGLLVEDDEGHEID